MSEQPRLGFRLARFDLDRLPFKVFKILKLNYLYLSLVLYLQICSQCQLLELFLNAMKKNKLLGHT